jgi:hypothetical protein
LREKKRKIYEAAEIARRSNTISQASFELDHLWFEKMRSVRFHLFKWRAIIISGNVLAFEMTSKKTVDSIQLKLSKLYT